jgi:hypothetical protein
MVWALLASAPIKEGLCRGGNACLLACVCSVLLGVAPAGPACVVSADSLVQLKGGASRVSDGCHTTRTAVTCECMSGWPGLRDVSGCACVSCAHAFVHMRLCCERNPSLLACCCCIPRPMFRLFRLEVSFSTPLLHVCVSCGIVPCAGTRTQPKHMAQLTCACIVTLQTQLLGHTVEYRPLVLSGSTGRVQGLKAVACQRVCCLPMPCCLILCASTGLSCCRCTAQCVLLDSFVFVLVIHPPHVSLGERHACLLASVPLSEQVGGPRASRAGARL